MHGLDKSLSDVFAFNRLGWAHWIPVMDLYRKCIVAVLYGYK